MDPRIEKVADILVNHSLKVKRGEKVMIATLEPCSIPFAAAVNRAVVKAGGYAQVQYLSEVMRHDLMKYGDHDQVTRLPDLESWGMEWADCYIALRGASNLYQHHDIDKEIKALNQKVQGQVSTLRWQKTRWCLIRIPNENMANQGQIDLETLEDEFFAACTIDFAELVPKWQALCDKLNQGDVIRIVSEVTDLSFSIKGRKFVVFDGTNNMPDGEIATAPVTETINGFIKFEHPAVLGGQLVEEPYLRWENGRLVEIKAKTNEEYFKRIINTDPGASLIGEFAFGLNSHLTVFTNDILLDEKIGGTIHIALGRAYPMCGGTNRSAIHWDIIKDTREKGEIFLDGKLIFMQGHFLF